MGEFRWVHVGVVAALAATVAVGGTLVAPAGADGSTSGSVFVVTAPCRLADTRAGADNVGARATPIGSGESVEFPVRGANGTCTIPTSAVAIVANATAVNPTASGYVSIYPTDADPRPTASNLNFVAGASPTPNQVTVALSATGSISAYNLSGNTDLIIDISGYYVPAAGVGPQGPVGPAGPTGPTGPTCPDTGCSVVVSGQSMMTSTFGAQDQVNPVALLSDFSCVMANPGSLELVPIQLPVGAKPTALQIRYVDNSNTGSTSWELRESVFGGASATVTSPFSTSDSAGTTATIGLKSVLPAVSLKTEYHLVGITQATYQYFCGLMLSYTF